VADVKSKNTTASDTLHTELCAAIADLAKSVEIAAARMALRAKITATIADAANAECAAETLRAVAAPSTQMAEQEQVSRVAVVATTERLPQQDSWTRDAKACDPVAERCSWLAATLGSHAESENQS